MKQPESTRLARTGQQGKGRVACTFRLTAPCVGSRRASAAPGGYRPSGPRKPGEAIADARPRRPPALADPDQPGQSGLADGTHVSAETSRRLACDASRVVMRHGLDGRVVEVAARTRTIPPALRRGGPPPRPGRPRPGRGAPRGRGPPPPP